MIRRNIFTIGGLAVLGVALAALPGLRAATQGPEEAPAASYEWALQKAEKALAQQEVVLDRAAAKLDEAEDKLGDLGMMGEEGSWLGVKMQEVTAENVKELKLPAERGVLVREVVPESPAAKAGLKANDVITELDGQRVEGTAQFHRMIHETPAGRTVHLMVWRDGKS